MIVAITGGTGFIGRKLVLLHLARGDAVRILSRRTSDNTVFPDSVEWHYGDLSDPEGLLPFVDGVDILYHCAGEIRNASLMKTVHIDGTNNLIMSATGRIGRWVQLSSVGAYGKRRDGVITEQTELRPVGDYEITKVGSDELVGNAATQGAFEHVMLRPSNVYAAEMTNQSLFGLISMVQRGLFFFIGKQGASANYIHVDNVAEALLLCGIQQAARGQTYNLSDYRPLEQFIGTIANSLGKECPRLRVNESSARIIARLFGSLPGFPLTQARIDALTGRAIYSSGKIENELNYHHVISMESGVSEMVEYWLRRDR